MSTEGRDTSTVYYDALYDNGGLVVPGQGRRLILSGEYKF